MKRILAILLAAAAPATGAQKRAVPGRPATAMPLAAAAAVSNGTPVTRTPTAAAAPAAGSLNAAFDGSHPGARLDPVEVGPAGPSLRLIVAGPPASGKEEASRRLVRDYGVIHLAAGKLLREYAKAHPDVADIMNRGDLVPAELVIRMMRQRMAEPDVRERGFVLDGFPRRLVEAKALTDAVKRGEAAFDAMIVLDVPEHELLRRVLERRRGLDDTEEVFRRRMEVYRTDTLPTIEYMATQIAVARPAVGQADVEASYANIRASLEGLLARRAGIEARYARLSRALTSYMSRKGYGVALDAFAFAREKHAGRRRDGLTPEFQHQVEIALFLTTLKDLPQEELALAAALLHDVVEDKPVSLKEIERRFGKRVARRVSLLSKEEEGRKKDLDVYFAGLARDPVASLVKGADRIHNLQGMIGVFSRQKQREYMDEVETRLLPMLKEAERRFPRHGAAYRNVRHMLKSQLALLKAVGAPDR